MDSHATESRPCAFCGRAVADFAELPRQGTQSCFACATRLGRLLVDAPSSLISVWPGLMEEDAEEPEPKVRLPDGRYVELRQHTAELKQELPIAQRLELAGTYGQIGLHREQLLECGYVLSVEPPRELAVPALQMLMSARFTAPDVLRRLRELLFPG